MWNSERRRRNELIQLALIDQMLRADPLGRQATRADPAPDRLRIAPDTTCGVGNGYHVSHTTTCLGQWDRSHFGLGALPASLLHRYRFRPLPRDPMAQSPHDSARLRSEWAAPNFCVQRTDLRRFGLERRIRRQIVRLTHTEDRFEGLSPGNGPKWIELGLSLADPCAERKTTSKGAVQGSWACQTS